MSAIAAVPDAAAVIKFTEELDSENAKRRTRCVATRMFTILESVQQFSAIVDTFVSSNPKIAALVWGSVKLALLVSLSPCCLFSSSLMSRRLRLTSRLILTNSRPSSWTLADNAQGIRSIRSYTQTQHGYRQPSAAFTHPSFAAVPKQFKYSREQVREQI